MDIKEVKDFFEASSYTNAVDILYDLLYESRYDEVEGFENILFGMDIFFSFPSYDLEGLEHVCETAIVQSPNEKYDPAVYKCSKGQFKMRQLLVACSIEYLLNLISSAIGDNGFNQFYFTQPTRKLFVPKEEAIEAIQSIIDDLESGTLNTNWEEIYNEEHE